MNLARLDTMASLIVASSLALGCGGSGSSSPDGSDTSSCHSPRGTVHVSISSAACTALSDACAELEVVAKSPRISSLIAQGKSPCTTDHSSPDGCSLGVRLWSLGFCLSPSSCGAKDIDLSTVFAPVALDDSREIEDTVTYCPVDADGNPVGNCAGTLVDQCEASAVTTVYVNSYTPPASTAQVTLTALSCATTSVETFGLKHCDVTSAGTAKGPVGTYFYALSNPLFADSVLVTCGSWTPIDGGCRHDAGQADTTTWARVFDDLWINPDTYTTGTRNVTVTGQVQETEYGTILAKLSRTVTCGE
jgi:hypothetical protein